MKIDVSKKFKFPKPVVCGLVMRITSPKGMREWQEATQRYHYRLHTDNTQIYMGAPVEMTDGLWWVVDIAKTKDLGLHWNHYLIEVQGKDIQVVEQYLNVKSSDWIPEALPTIKSYFRTSAD